MKNSLTLKILAWLVLWIAGWIIFIDYLPSHAHFEYMGLVAPFVLVIIPFYGSGITGDAWSLVIIPGLIFWAVITLLVIQHRRQTRQVDN